MRTNDDTLIRNIFTPNPDTISNAVTHHCHYDSFCSSQEGPCLRPDCTALRDSEDLEEKIFDERQEMEEKVRL